MFSRKIEVDCAHCDKEFGVEFIKYADDPRYFNLDEDSDQQSKITSSAQLNEEQKEFEDFYSSVVVYCTFCGNENIVQIPTILVPKKLMSKYAVDLRKKDEYL